MAHIEPGVYGIFTHTYNQAFTVKDDSLDDTNIVLSPWVPKPAQLFRITKVHKDNFSNDSIYYIHTVISNERKCLDIAGASKYDGAPVFQCVFNGQTNQQFFFLDVGISSNGTQKLYCIMAIHSGKYLVAREEKYDPGVDLIQWTDNKTDAYKFWLGATT